MAKGKGREESLYLGVGQMNKGNPSSCCTIKASLLGQTNDAHILFLALTYKTYHRRNKIGACFCFAFVNVLQALFCICSLSSPHAKDEVVAEISQILLPSTAKAAASLKMGSCCLLIKEGCEYTNTAVQ